MNLSLSPFCPSQDAHHRQDKSQLLSMAFQAPSVPPTVLPLALQCFTPVFSMPSSQLVPQSSGPASMRFPPPIMNGLSPFQASWKTPTHTTKLCLTITNLTTFFESCLSSSVGVALTSMHLQHLGFIAFLAPTTPYYNYRLTCPCISQETRG